jgi:small neutral amino acid transporter SnatA (MarC family)
VPAKILRDALILLTTIDPIGTVLVFASLTATFDERGRAVLARRATVIAGIILLAFLAVGQLALGARHVSPLMRLLGQSGGAALIRILGMVLGALAVELCVEGSRRSASLPYMADGSWPMAIRNGERRRGPTSDARSASD